MIQGTGRPIFVVGAARSGTSAISLGLMRGAGLPGYNEGHVWPLLDRLYRTVDDYFGNGFKEKIRKAKQTYMIASLDPEALTDGIASSFIQFVEDLFEPDVWVDKTPDPSMIAAVPLVAELFPQARFVFAKRRGIENVVSRTKKFPGRSFEQHCTLWAASMQQWLQARAQLPEERYIEIDQHDVALHPAETAQQVGAFLGLNQEQIDGVSRFWRTQRPQQSRAAQDYRYLDLDQTGWSEQEQAIFVRVCGPLMEQYGYSLESQIFPEAFQRPIYLYHPVTPVDEAEIRLENVAKEDFRLIPHGFSLALNAPDQAPPNVRYGRLVFFGHNHFSALLHLKSPGATPAEFRLQIEPPTGSGPVFERCVVVPAGREVLWEIALPALEGRYEVVISTALAEGAGSHPGARARWKKPHFSIR